MSSSSGSEYEPDAYELEDDEYHERRRKKPARRGRASRGGDTDDDAGPSEYSDGESGYTTGGYTTGEDDDDYFASGEMFESGMLDPLALLEDMEAASGPPDREQGQAVDTGGGTAGRGLPGARLQPFQVFRKQRKAAAAAARQARAAAGGDDTEAGGGSDGDGDGDGAATGQEEDVQMRDAPSTSAGGARGTRAAARRTKASKSADTGGGAFGADFDDIVAEEDLADDPLAQQLGLVDPAGRRRRGKGRRLGKGRRKSKKNQVPEEVSAKLGQANLLYATAKYQEAADLLMEVIKAAPNVSDPYHTLGLLHEAMGNSRKALDFHMIAAHLTPKDIGLWKRLAALSTEVGYLRQAIYCLGKAVSHSPGRSDCDARWDRAILHAELGELSKAARQFEQVAGLRPGDPEAPKMLARLHHRQGLPLKAIQVLEKYMEEHPGRVDLTHINILAELYMETGSFLETHNLIMRAAEAISSGVQEGEEPDEENTLPMDLVAKDGLCLAHLGRSQESEEALSPLRELGPSTYPDLYLDTGVSLAAMGQYAPAAHYLQGLLDVPEFGNDPALWARLLMCYRALGDLDSAVKLYATKIDTLEPTEPSYLETAITLCELWVEAGHKDKATALLRTLPDTEQAMELVAAATGPQAAQTPAAIAAAAAAAQVGGSSPAAAAAAAGGGAGGGSSSSGTGGGTALLMRKNKLHLMLGQQQEFVDAVLPMVQDALAKLASDNAAVTNPNIPKHIIRAIMRRRMLERKGLAQARLKGGESSLFAGRRVQDRRKEHVKQADDEADAILAAMGGDRDDGDGDPFNSRSGQGRATALRAMFTDDDGLNTFTTLCRSLVDVGRLSEARELSSRAVSLCGAVCRWFPRSRRDVLALVLAELHTAAGDIQAALKSLKGVLGRWPASCHAWSLLCQLGTVAPGLCSTRAWTSLIMSNRKRSPASLPAMLMQGHVHLMARQHYDALGEYFQAYRFWPTEPLLLLCIGVTYISHAISRRCDDRNKAILQGWAFLQMYEEQRGNLHESSYNIGRAAHQLGLLHIAQHYYERALAAADDLLPSQAVFIAGGSQPGKIGTAKVKTLTAEIAHNLALIYRSSGATHLVRRLYLKYLTVW